MRVHSNLIQTKLISSCVVQVRQEDPNVLVGLTVHSAEMAKFPDGTHKYQQWWRHLGASLLDRIGYYCLISWVWRVLAVDMLLSFKGDVLDGRCHTKYYWSLALCCLIISCRVDITQLHKTGMAIVVWTVNEEQDKKYFQKIQQIPFISDINAQKDCY